MISAYLWSHFGDLLKDPDATDAYRKWASLIRPSDGLALDIGCSVGRLSFELSPFHRHVVGLDTSLAFIENARKLLQSKRVGFDMIIEGMITERRECSLNGDWRHDRTEFIVADAMALPFRTSDFNTVCSVNILEKVPDPMGHLTEVDRVLSEETGLFIFSDPFSWDENVSPPDLWIGGSANGANPGRGAAAMRRLMSSGKSLFSPALEIVEAGDVSWKIRKTENLWEHITSQFLVGAR
jgi:SAM-dependent methyltransferase